MKWLLTIFAAALAIGFIAWKLCFPGQNVPTATPSLLNQWEDQVYSLDADEAIRLIPPPFTPQRLKQFPISANPRAQLSFPQVMWGVVAGQLAYSSASTGKGTVRSAFMWCTFLHRSPQLELSQVLAELPAEGDWIVRQEAPREQRLKALESILSAVTGRKLAIERPSVERDVIIARGKWDFHPSDDPKAQFYTLTRDTRRGGSGTLADSFASLERDLGRRIIDETEEPRPRQVFWTGRAFAASDDDSRRTEMLASLEKQTSLKFVQTRRVIPVWIVSEKGQRQ